MRLSKKTACNGVVTGRFSSIPVWGLAILFAFGLWPARISAAEPPPASAGPVLKVDGAGQELKPVLEGEGPTHCFILSNEGASELQLWAVRPWKRTRILHADRKILPGGKGRIEVALETGGFGGLLTGGVTVLTNCKDKPHRRMTVAVPVTPLIAVSPDRLFIDVAAGQRGAAELTIGANIDTPLELKPISMPPPETVSWTLKAVEPGRRFVLSASARLAGRTVFRDRLVFRTNYPRTPRLTIPLLVRALPPVQAVPAAVDFGKVHLPRAGVESSVKRPVSAPRPSRQVFIRLNRGEDLAVGSIRCDCAALTWTVTPAVPGRVLRLDLRLDPAALKPGDLAATLTVTTNQESTPLEIPFTAKVLPSQNSG